MFNNNEKLKKVVMEKILPDISKAFATLDYETSDITIDGISVNKTMAEELKNVINEFIDKQTELFIDD